MTDDDAEEVTYLKHIDDIESPFCGPVSSIPLNEMFSLDKLDIIIRMFCIKQISPYEKSRLKNRHFIPSTLLCKDGESGDG